MLIEFAVGFGGFVERERAGDMDLEGAGLYQTVELLNLLWIRLDVITLNLHAGRRFWLGLDAVGIGDASVSVHRAQCAIGSLATGGDESGIQTIRSESARYGFDVVFTAI